MAFTSIHGRRLGMTQSQLLFDSRPVNDRFASRGKTIYVDSAKDAASGINPDEAVGTLDEAFALCTANQGDTIVVMPNHAETVTGAGGITHDVAGVSVIGLGRGNQRPRFLMDGGTTVTYVVSAADAYVENLVFASGHADVVTCFNVTGLNAAFNGIEFEDNTTDENWLSCFKATGAANTANGLTIENCRYVTPDAGATDFLSLVDDINKLTFRGNFYCADAATGAGMILCATGKDILGLACERNVFICGNTAGDLFIDNDTAVNTGYAAYNLIGHHDTASAILFDCDGIRLFENYSTAADDASGVILPAIDVDGS